MNQVLLWLVVLVGFVAIVLEAVAVRKRVLKGFTVSGNTPPASQGPSPDRISDNVLTLTRQSRLSRPNYLKSMRQNNRVNGHMFAIVPLIEEEISAEFVAEITFGKQTFLAVVDTGSSDTWLAETGFACESDVTGDAEPQSACLFGPTYNPNMSCTFTKLPDLHFYIEYGDGEYLFGFMGTEKVTFGGISVKNQEVGVVNIAAWDGDGVTSGLVGLAFSALTSAYAGANETENTTFPVVYKPIFTNMYERNLLAPLFSFALVRGNQSFGGLLALGGIPDVPHSPIFASTPIQILYINGMAFDGDETTPVYTFYTVDLGGFVYEGSNLTKYNSSSFLTSMFSSSAGTLQAIVDTGTTLLYVPSAIANASNALFSPPAVYNSTAGAFTVPCDAIAPKFGVSIGRETFYINAKDLIFDNGDTTCVSGIVDGGEGPYILGDVFLKNVLAVFDLGAMEMRFAARECY
ncbi:unnamed protein product [Didymodactylos carnosus]|uniref:Peptidase A1 domain-containing protein n=1 Tax=Didymodactylos carnosus TaxID=1234261 RepID=A0A814ZIV9_9BILA|nr:unnamed protein product [Didymodactylos carnosus]CAF1418390.1 unnamed protein product [Didymodactylos carnosus]CAF4011927.1 unnamed protein product [Didymodactylos carnosus]CAF4219960.1 unnamed protein product [Didymodactylos carnosus]